jgi:hypothetical protein
LLKLRRGRVLSIEARSERVARITVRLELGGEARAAIAYPSLTGDIEPGDEVVVNVEGQDLGLGSGGFDILCANLTRGIGGEGAPAAHVMKLNYTPIQHAVKPLEEGLEELRERLDLPAVVLALHGQLPCAAFAFSQRAPGRRVGYVQTAGGALVGQLSDTVAELLRRGLIADHVTVAPCFGGGHEAVTLEGSLHAGAEQLEWDAALIGPGPGILGSASALGHGGLAALHSAHSALSLGCEVVLAPRLSAADERPRHRGLSHHTRAVLALLLMPVSVAVPDGISQEARADLERSLEAGPGHEAVEAEVGELVTAYLGSGLPAETMGRSFERDEDFLRAGLAAGAALAKGLGQV